MPRNREIDVDCHYGIGPYTDVYGHGPVTIFNRPEEDVHSDGKRPVAQFAACLDCGYLAPDLRLFAHEDCERAENTIAQTWRERLDDRGFPEALDD